MVGVCEFARHGSSAMPRCRPVVCSALSVLGVVSITHGDSLLGLACTPVSASEISVAKEDRSRWNRFRGTPARPC